MTEVRAVYTVNSSYNILVISFEIHYFTHTVPYNPRRAITHRVRTEITLRYLTLPLPMSL